MAAVDRHPTAKDLKTFGLLLPAFVVLVGFVVRHRTGSSAAAGTLWAVGAALSALYWAAPAVRRPIFVGWTAATYPIGWVVSHAVLAVVYFGVVTPIALLLRLAGRDPLDRRIDPSAASYWVPRDDQRPAGRYFRQY